MPNNFLSAVACRYAEGTADAVAYLAKQLQDRSSSASSHAPVIYSMVDVLNAGAL